MTRIVKFGIILACTLLPASAFAQDANGEPPAKEAAKPDGDGKASDTSARKSEGTVKKSKDGKASADDKKAADEPSNEELEKLKALGYVE